jgi:hypothetical protein
LARQLGKVNFRMAMLLEQDDTGPTGKKQNTRETNEKTTNITIKFSRRFDSLRMVDRMFLAPTALTKEFSRSLSIEMNR